MSAKYLRLRPAALALPTSELEVFQADAVVVRNNARIAVNALAPHRAALATRMPTTDWDQAFGALDLAEALVAADERCAPVAVSSEQIAATREELQALRAPGLLIARGLALLGYLPLAEVERIEAGTGLIDMGRDGIALATLFRTNATALAGLHPFTPARIDRLEVLGEWILRNVVPAGARTATTTEPDGDRALCDRFWTLLVRAHRTLRQGAFVVYGEDFGAHVPALRAYVASARGTTDAPATPATPTPDAPPTA